MGNLLRTTLLLTALTVLLVLIGQAIGGTAGLIVAFLFALALNAGSYWFSDRLALAGAGAREVSAREAPGLHHLINRLALQAGMPRPRVYLIEAPSPNAFATGRDPAHGAVAVTTGLLDILDQRELAAVIAHELAHIKNRDTLIATIAATVAGAITFLANLGQIGFLFGGGHEDDAEDGSAGGLLTGLLMVILAPIAATVIQLAVSRTREYAADARGARILGDPLALANALEKLEWASRHRPLAVDPAAAHLYIVHPFGGSGWTSLLSTHPTTADRIARLRRLAARAAQPQIDRLAAWPTRNAARRSGLDTLCYDAPGAASGGRRWSSWA